MVPSGAVRDCRDGNALRILLSDLLALRLLKEDLHLREPSETVTNRKWLGQLADTTPKKICSSVTVTTTSEDSVKDDALVSCHHRPRATQRIHEPPNGLDAFGASTWQSLLSAHQFRD